MVRATYGIAWTYVLADVSYNGYQKQQEGGSNADIAWTMGHALTFQVSAIFSTNLSRNIGPVLVLQLYAH